MNLTHNLSGVVVNQRAIDGYINATALATAHKQATGKQKNVADWLRNKRTQETLEHLGSNMGKSVFELYQVFEGSPDNGGGTWLHPKLSVRFAMWLSDDFGFQVENWVEQWMTEGKNPIAQQPIPTAELPAIMPTEQEISYMKSREWERLEMEGIWVNPEEVKRRSGYRRAIDIARSLGEKASQKALPPDENK
jgi:hypothetical protein